MSPKPTCIESVERVVLVLPEPQYHSLMLKKKHILPISRSSSPRKSPSSKIIHGHSWFTMRRNELDQNDEEISLIHGQKNEKKKRRKKKRNQVLIVLKVYKNLLVQSQLGVLNLPISLRIFTDEKLPAFQKSLHTEPQRKYRKLMKIMK